MTIANVNNLEAIQTEGDEDEGGAFNPFKKRRTMKADEKAFKVGIGGLAVIGKNERLKLIADAFIAKFETLKSKLGSKGSGLDIANVHRMNMASKKR